MYVAYNKVLNEWFSLTTCSRHYKRAYQKIRPLKTVLKQYKKKGLQESDKCGEYETKDLFILYYLNPNTKQMEEISW